MSMSKAMAQQGSPATTSDKYQKGCKNQSETEGPSRSANYAAGYYDGVNGLPFNPSGELMPRTPENTLNADRIAARLYLGLKEWAGRGFAGPDRLWHEAKTDIIDLLRLLAQPGGDGWIPCTDRRYLPGTVLEYRLIDGGESARGVCEILAYDQFAVLFKPTYTKALRKALHDVEFRPRAQ